MIDTSEVLKADVLVVGAGPAGSTYARFLCQNGRKVLLMDAGEQIGPRPGVHLKNLYANQRQMRRFDRRIQSSLYPISVSPSVTGASKFDSKTGHTCVGPGNGINPNQNAERNLDGACAAYFVGGMALLWTCAIPRHHPTMERIEFISPQEWETLYGVAEFLLNKHTNVYERSVRNTLVRDALADHYSSLEPAYGVQNLPLAAERSSTNTDCVYFTGTDRILSPVIDSEKGSVRGLLTILPRHQVRRLHVYGGRVEYAEAYDSTRRSKLKVHADIFVVAAGTVMSAQLLWVSGLRLPALGRYMIEHPLATTQVVLSRSLVDSIPNDSRFAHQLTGLDARDSIPIPQDDPPPSIWIPVSTGRPWHCQVYRGNCAAPEEIDERLVVDFRWFASTEPRRDNRVHFSDDFNNEFGMPQPTFEFQFSEGDSRRMHDMMADMIAAAQVLGTIAPGGQPRFMPSGRCLHIQGTCRMGKTDDGETVVDPNSKVWGVDNLYIGGNSVIPTANACNPTLTNVALATKSAWSILGRPMQS